MDSFEDERYSVQELANDQERSIVFWVDRNEDPDEITSFMVPRTQFPRVPAVGECIHISLERQPDSPIAYEPYHVKEVSWFVRVGDKRGPDGTLRQVRVRLGKGNPGSPG